jgi:hypothetical protein
MLMALEELESLADVGYGDKGVIQTLRDRLAQPEPEPVAWADKYDIDREGHDFWVSRQQPAKNGVPLYTAPVHAIDIPQERVDETAKHKHEPVAWLSKCYSDDNEDLGYNLWDIDVGEGCVPVYLAPKQWVGFTHEELAWLNEALNLGGRLAVIEAIEDKLKRKNHGVD